jgi:ectoine hydroxylase
MLEQQVLAHPTTVLSEVQRAFYFEHGYLALPNYVPDAWLKRLRAATAELVENSRQMRQSDGTFILEEGHSAAKPRLHRIASPEAQHPEFWSFMADPVMTDLAADVVGPDVKFHHGKLNLKAGEGSRGFKWHQDIQAWPHTDYSPVSIGVYFDGCGEDQGPVAFARGSHKGPLFSMYDEHGNFVVRIRDNELGWLDEAQIDAPTGGPGLVVLINCRVVHGSVTNRSPKARPLLLTVYSSADSFAYTPAPIGTPRLGDIVRGQPAKYACFDTRPCELPPDWRGGYRQPWTYQKEEEQRKQAAY